MFLIGRSMITKKGDGSQVKESTDSSSTTLEDDDIKGKSFLLYKEKEKRKENNIYFNFYQFFSLNFLEIKDKNVK